MPIPIGISASRGAAILGLSEWQTPVSVWLQIMESRQPGFCAAHGYELPVIEYNAAMRWGHAFESAIIELAEGKADDAPWRKIIDREKFFPDNEKLMKETGYAIIDPFITCHIDGMYERKSINEMTLHEGKTTSAFNFRNHFGEPGTDRVPVEYQIQAQHQMICTGAEKVILSVLVFPRRVEEWEEMGWMPINDCGRWELQAPNGMHFSLLSWAHTLNQMGYFHNFIITSNPELQALMLQKYAAFWTDHVLTGTPPQPRSYDDIKAICREPVGTIIATEEIERLCAERKQIVAEISGAGPLAKRGEQIKVQVLDFMRGSGATIDDESTEKWILRSRDGKKIAQYGRTKSGSFMFR